MLPIMNRITEVFFIRTDTLTITGLTEADNDQILKCKHTFGSPVEYLEASTVLQSNTYTSDLIPRIVDPGLEIYYLK